MAPRPLWLPRGDSLPRRHAGPTLFALSRLCLPSAAARRLTPFPPFLPTQVSRTKVPLELEEGELPLNTFNNKAPFKVRGEARDANQRPLFCG